MAETLLSSRLAEIRYLPVLAIRPAEMKALEELPENDKNLLLPLIVLRPWLASNDLAKTFEKIDEAYGTRPWIADVEEWFSLDDEVEIERPVIKELRALADPSNGFANWCKFIANRDFMIPCVQLREKSELLPQIVSLSDIGRGIVVKLPRQGFSRLDEILSALSSIKATDFLFIFDFGQSTESDLVDVATCAAFIRKVIKKLPGCNFAVSLTSFPDSFTDLKEAAIIERGFHKAVSALLLGITLIYSDRGSARVKSIGGGGRKPIPRIDYPVPEKWYFSRFDDDDGGYQSAAKSLIGKSYWQDKMRVWGTQMIERTSLNDPYAITSPARATAVRINLHLHRQVFFSNPDDAIKLTDDDWVD